MRKILFSRDNECIQPLRELIEKQTHRTLILWTLDCAKRFLDMFEKAYPDEKRPTEVLLTADKWAHGEVKMSVAKKAIHACHNAATSAEVNSVAQAAARAIGQAAATVHVETHALGMVFYGLTALLYEAGIFSAGGERAQAVIDKELKWFYEQLLFWEENTENDKRKWAAFLLTGKTNKELVLRQKYQNK